MTVKKNYDKIDRNNKLKKVKKLPDESLWTPFKSKRQYRTHPPSVCVGQPCPVHNVTDHPMKDWPQHYREDTGVTERICKHGCGHPDPDQPWPKDDHRWLHGCCGCGHSVEKDETEGVTVEEWYAGFSPIHEVKPDLS